MDSSKAKPWDKAVLKQTSNVLGVFYPGNGVCLIRFYYKMWGSQYLGILRLLMITTAGGTQANEIWKTTGMLAS